MASSTNTISILILNCVLANWNNCCDPLTHLLYDHSGLTSFWPRAVTHTNLDTGTQIQDSTRMLLYCRQISKPRMQEWLCKTRHNGNTRHMSKHNTHMVQINTITKEGNIGNACYRKCQRKTDPNTTSLCHLVAGGSPCYKSCLLLSPLTSVSVKHSRVTVYSIQQWIEAGCGWPRVLDHVSCSCFMMTS